MVLSFTGTNAVPIASKERNRPMTTATRNSTRPACVLVDGPFPDVDHDGDEIPTWSVCLGDEDGEPFGTVYRCFTHAKARDLGARMSRDRRLELVDESSPA